MLSPAQVMFREAWGAVADRRDLELSPVEGGFAHLESRTLILLASSDLEAQARDYGWTVRRVDRALELTALAADLRRRMERERGAA